jgi:catechol 2,3-dioxygenase-like lactoylglutathione lyase family enzyme
MFDHVSIRASDLDASEHFYRTVLSRLEIAPTRTSAGCAAWNDLRILAADRQRPATRNLHVGFVAPSRAHVDAFWRAGTDAGYTDDGAPGERPQYTPGYYGAFLRDPDGNSAEAVDHADTRRGGNIDHVWIGVRDLDTATAFYAAIARHTGLRRGRVWEHGIQFRGDWATFSLVADGRPPTEGLQMAFGAPDRQTVREFHAAALAAGSDQRDAEAPAEGPHGYVAGARDPDGGLVQSVHRDTSNPAN